MKAYRRLKREQYDKECIAINRYIKYGDTMWCVLTIFSKDDSKSQGMFGKCLTHFPQRFSHPFFSSYMFPFLFVVSYVCVCVLFACVYVLLEKGIIYHYKILIFFLFWVLLLWYIRVGQELRKKLFYIQLDCKYITEIMILFIPQGVAKKSYKQNLGRNFYQRTLNN